MMCRRCLVDDAAYLRHQAAAAWGASDASSPAPRVTQVMWAWRERVLSVARAGQLLRQGGQVRSGELVLVRSGDLVRSGAAAQHAGEVLLSQPSGDLKRERGRRSYSRAD